MKFCFVVPCRFFLVIIGAIFLNGTCSGLQADTAPSTYSAYTGTDAKAIPAAPALGPANSVINDPTFGSRILRHRPEHECRRIFYLYRFRLPPCLECRLDGNQAHWSPRRWILA